jgi:hypothetical protein
MFKVLIPGVIGVVFILLLRTPKQQSKTYNVVERESSLYIDTNGTPNEYINSNNQINNRYEY